MSNQALIMSLGKVIAAAAWADDEMTVDEVNRLKDLLYRLPSSNNSGVQLAAQDWAQLEMYINAPVNEAERARLVDNLRDAVRTPADRQIALDALQSLEETGSTGQREADVIHKIRVAIEAVDLSLGSRLSQMLGLARPQPSLAPEDAPNREQFFDAYLRNRVYYGLRRRLQRGTPIDDGLEETHSGTTFDDDIELNVADEELRRLAAVGGLMARVAQVDQGVTDAEFDVMVKLLRERWSLPHKEALFVAEVALSEVGPQLDTMQLVRELSSEITPEQGVRLLDLLFALADADGFVTGDEVEAIYQIANSLALPHRQFIEAKRRIPSERRDG